jgi:gluconate 2-dehydrogenase gamma chain
MPKNDATRRDFLIRAAVGAGAAASAGIVPGAYGQTHGEPQKEEPSAHARPLAGGGQGAFFNHADSETIAAFAERLMPGAPDKPGAHDAGVLNYIDLALSGAYADLQDFYRRGLEQLDAHCRKTYKQPFVYLQSSQMDEVITALEEGKATGFTWPSSQEFFNTVRTHTVEGMFADPIYGGNKDFAGWRLVGFPGAQANFTSADLQSSQAFVRAPVIGLQAVGKAPIRRQ